MFANTKPALFLVALLLLCACSEPALGPLPPGGTILAFGDSLTVGVGARPSESYPSVLAGLCECQVVNAGVSGEVTAEGLTRLPREIQKTSADILILLEGGNDILRDVDPAATKQNIAAMIELAQANGIAVVLIGVPAKKLFSNTASFYHELSEEYELVFEKKLVAGLLRDRELKSDPIHFNEQGYRVLAESIHELLIEQGAL